MIIKSKNLNDTETIALLEIAKPIYNFKGV